MHYSSIKASLPMLRITTEKKKGRTVLNVEGRFIWSPRANAGNSAGGDAGRFAGRKFQVNLCGVRFNRRSGKDLLKAMYSEGAQLLAEGCLNQAIVSEITAEQKAGGAGNAAKGQAFFSILRSSVWCSERSQDSAQTTASRRAEVDAGAVGSIGAEAEYDGADCGFDGGRSEARQKHFAVEPDSDANLRFRIRRGGRTSKQDSAEDSGDSGTFRAVSSF